MLNKIKEINFRKKPLIITGIILLIVTIILLSLNSYLGLKVKAIIESEINTNPKSTYTIHYKRIRVNIYSGSVRFKDLIIEPLKSKNDSLNVIKKKPSFVLKIKSFEINNIHIFNFFKTKKLQVKNIKIDDIDLNLLVDKSTKHSSLTKKNEPLNILSESINGVLVDYIFLNNLSLNITDINNPEKPFLNLHSLSLEITDVILDSTTNNNPFPVSFENLKIRTKEIAYNSMEFYSINTAGIEFNLNDSTVKVLDLNFTPKFSQAEHNNKMKYQNDLFSISTNEVIIHKIQLHKLFYTKAFYSHLIEISNPDIDIYRDKRLPKSPDKFKPLLGSLLKKIPISFCIDSLVINQGKLVYGEMQTHTNNPGEIVFNNLKISCFNLTNDVKHISRKPELQIDLSAKLMGEANMKVNINFDLKKIGDHVRVKGEMGKINGRKLNKMVENLLLVKIQSGDIYSTSFNFEANDKQALGEMKMDYKNLKIKVLKQEKNKEYKTFTFLANTLIHKNNMPTSTNYKTGTIYFNRDKNKGFPNYLWKSIQSGLISIVATVAESKQQKEIRKKKKKGRRKK